MRNLKDITAIDFQKLGGLVPAIIQDVATHKVLMLGYMNKEAIEVSLESRKVTLFSRSKKRLWTKGEVSQNYLKLYSMALDCDGDALLIKAKPEGPTCHTGADTCWDEDNQNSLAFLELLTQVIQERKTQEISTSYTAKMFDKGINKLAQKVGEEAVEMVIEAKDNNDDLFLNESADLLFHYMMLLEAKGFTLSDVSRILKDRHK